MKIELTKLSSKGQIVIPRDLREKMGLNIGEVLAVSTRKNLIVLKKIENPILESDLKTLNEIENAWKEIESGKCRKMGSEEFLKEISKW